MQTITVFDEAIQLTIPTGWLDVSSFRQVPDNQYVWVETNPLQGGERFYPSHGRSGEAVGAAGAFTSRDGLPLDKSLILELLQWNPEWTVEHYAAELLGEWGATDSSSVLYPAQDLQLLAAELDPNGDMGLATQDDSIQKSIMGLVCQVAKFNSTVPDSVLVVLGLIRLESVATDALVTLNIPLDAQRHHDADNVNATAQAGVHTIAALLASFTVLSYDLFAT
ncbi:hypothetical protein HDV03_000253 [Kappamyces sp. JEL0829]|nr:hypothetical protein HDV03_000253 [Kappamyces sp. JEL0829]